MKKEHAGINNQNAKKEEPKTSYIQMRVTQRQKATWVKQSQAKGMKLSTWITAKLNDEL